MPSDHSLSLPAWKGVSLNQITHVGKLIRTYDAPSPLHSHPSLELIYCVSGFGYFRFGKAIQPYTAGQIVVIPSGLEHSNYSENGITNFCMHIEEPTLPFTDFTVINDDPEGSIRHCFENAFLQFNNQGNARSILLAPLGNLIVNYLIAYQNYNLMHPVVTEIQESICAHYQDPSYDLNAFMETLPFSSDYLRQLFKRQLGTTPHAYLSEYRLQSVASLLSALPKSTSNISDIAQSCGFNDPLYMSRVFKSKFGVSPSQYVAQVQKAKQKMASETPLA